MEKTTWGELLWGILKKLLLALAKLAAFFVWLALAAVQLLLAEITKNLKAWLFPGRK